MLVYKREMRDIAVTVEMSKADLTVLEQAAARLWRGAILTRSSMLLSLAKLGAQHGGMTKKS